MAQKSISRLEGFDFASRDTRLPEGGAGDAAPDSFASGPLTARASRNGSTADLALDLVLHEMLQQARLTSSATGAAVALLEESGVRCRATAGATASEVDAYLRTKSKLVEGCLRSGDVQRCDDTESDTRFDVAACRRLGLRSILICAVRDSEEKPVGVVELFSSRPGAFADRDVLMLQAIGQRIVNNLGLVQRLAAPGLAFPVEAQPVARESARDEDSEPFLPRPAREESTLQLRARVQKAFQIDSRLFLLVAAITLSIILGWMLGRTQGLRVKGRAKPHAAQSAQVIENPSPAPANSDTLAQPVETSGPTIQLPDSSPAAVVEISRIPKASSHSGLKHSVLQPAGSTSVSAESSPESVVVFEDNKDDNKDSFKTKPVQSSQPNPAPSGSQQNTGAPANHKGIAHVPAEQAEANLLVRVEPDYPEKAREQKTQGPVVLDVAVGKDGLVQRISTISGDPQLAPAAAQAVQQWRFKPWVRNGQPAPFESRITLNFSLR